MYKVIIRPVLFSFSPEKAHQMTFLALKSLKFLPFLKYIMKRCFLLEDARLSKNIFGINFPNPIGLAAGLDKNGEVFNELACFGFGFIEVGTVTPLPQPGNTKPRLFRLVKDSALINRMGFNNQGVEKLTKRLRKRNKNLIIGGNIGKNTATSNEDAAKDYLYCFKRVYEYVDYIAINVSCPNVENLRDLQHADSLEIILDTLCKERVHQSDYKPLVLKISPDSDVQHLDLIVELCIKYKIDGIIATNTTTDREKLMTNIEKIGKGGLSGMPLRDKSTQIIQYLHQKSQGKLPIIACGGVFSGSDAENKLKAGASLVQIYTSFIYEGPAIVNRINKHLLKLHL